MATFCGESVYFSSYVLSSVYHEIFNGEQGNCAPTDAKTRLFALQH